MSSRADNWSFPELDVEDVLEVDDELLVLSSIFSSIDIWSSLPELA
jgi:hypothetical protein